ncbi:helix-turn-helix domain-containing protein [Alkalicoccobacillus gibsonii]|uniref:helix-turn-helix domain-containing protein n=1 Tax=Alkalicoccobacillus gibsonii TaxID=79881 RepID=UPI00193274C7|nr:helix-turn-helix transcriptional regulator [Alkalicoccobacillus gibsonii]MBM0064758.1 helix-turn-helix transcriptional regulator [Alkalicoccobacillus gibsonii]
MIGLEYIIKTFNKSFSQVSSELELSRQTMNSWLKGRRNISKKHLPKLSEMFNLPEEFFQKELTQSERLRVQQGFIQQEDEGEEVPIFNDEGKELNQTRTYYQNEYMVRQLEQEIRSLERKEWIAKQVERLFKIESDEYNNSTEDLKLNTDLKLLINTLEVLGKDRGNKQRFLLKLLLQIFVLDQGKASDDWDVMADFFNPKEYLGDLPDSFEKAFIKLLFDEGFITNEILNDYIK